MRRSLPAAIDVLLLATFAQAGSLHEAAGDGDIAEVRRLLAEGADVDQRDLLGTPLNTAALMGQLAVVELLVAEGAAIGTPVGEPGPTPLHMAAIGGDRDVVAFLLSSGADIDARDAAGNTPLHMAADKGNVSAAEALIAAGADVNARNNMAHAPAHLAGASDHFDLVDLLISRGAAAPPVDPIAGLLAGADPEQGRLLFVGCRPCHWITKDGPADLGPNLWGVLERPKASSPTFGYSGALTRLAGMWSYEELNAFLANPGGAVPGTEMAGFGFKGVRGVKDPADRANLIAFLRENGDDPPPLPE